MVSKLTTMQARNRLNQCERAAEDLRRAAFGLRAVGATQAAAYVRRALKSVEGATRHAARLVSELEAQEIADDAEAYARDIGAL